MTLLVLKIQTLFLVVKSLYDGILKILIGGNKFMQWRNLYRGFFIGITDLIPGVSGGTIAFLLGIYDELLTSISGFFSRNWKKYIGFLLPLGIGIGVTLLLFSRVIEYLLKNYYAPTQFFFLGLIIGILPFLTKQVNVKKDFKFIHLLVLLIVATALASLAFINPIDDTPITKLTSSNALGLFLAGWAGSMAMLLPRDQRFFYITYSGGLFDRNWCTIQS